ncbi:MAG: ATP-grasp domain-containing protein [Planctomycetota bacterium]|jgi:carbamoyl-phosphate synthase large subunit
MKKQSGSDSMYGVGKGRGQVRIVFTCAGRRVELIQAFKRAAASLGIKALIHTADADAAFAASCIADRSHLVPAVNSPQYIPALLKLAQKNKIDLLFPLIDTELPKLARAREKFARISCSAIISSTRVMKICQDKLLTYDFLTNNGIDTPQTCSYKQALNKKRHRFPYFLKPRKGSASKGNFIIKNKTDLKALGPRVPDAIIQEFVPGGCVVPRKRVEVRGGEVTRALTVNHPGIIETGFKVAEALGECVGVITIQLFLTSDGRIRVIEINPRFGGGVPLAIQAGANFPKWIIAEWMGKNPRIRLVNFKAGLMMLRYHQAFFQQSKKTNTLGRKN